MNNHFKNGEKTKNISQRSVLETRYNSGVVNLLAVVGFSLINVVLLVMNSNTYFLFSACIPYALADIGMDLCGMYPEEYYYDLGDIEFFDKSFLAVMLAVAAIVILLYFISFLFAKKKKVGWLIFAFVFFCIDTAAMFYFYGFSVDYIMDIVFHAWVLFSLGNSIFTYFKLKNLPEDDGTDWEEAYEQFDFENSIENTSILRMAEIEVKEKIFLEADVQGFHIVYRRVKKTNELVVNGAVYDEYEALVEFPHTLTALIDGHKIEALHDAKSFMYIVFDGEVIAKKLRLI